MSKDNGKMKEKIIFDNVLEVMVIDKATGKVKQHVKVKNAVIRGFINYWWGYMFAPENTATYSDFVGFQYMNLFNTAKGYIKSLSGSWGTQADTGSAFQNTLTTTDTSTDAYTVAYVGASRGSNNTYGTGQFFIAQLPSPISKGSGDSLVFKWTFSMPYSAPP